MENNENLTNDVVLDTTNTEILDLGIDLTEFDITETKNTEIQESEVSNGNNK